MNMLIPPTLGRQMLGIGLGPRGDGCRFFSNFVAILEDLVSISGLAGQERKKERNKVRKEDRLFSQHSTYYTLYHGITI